MAKSKTRKAPRQPWQGKTDKAETLRTWGINSRSSAEEVRAATKRYDKEYNSFQKRVRNYNAVTGNKYSASRMFLIAQQIPKSQYSKSMNAIFQTSTAQPHTAGPAVVKSKHNIETGVDAMEKIWGGARKTSKTISNLWDRYERGEITLDQFNEGAREWGKKMNEARRDRENGDPTIGSDI
jgi:hypothetical protein